jgi:tetratricopeptide (TPR) repeat protein
MTTLDAEELMHLGLQATQNNATDTALIYLKQSLELEPDDARTLHLLAANYAQIGMYERAKALFQRTVEIAPREYAAVFQLGLLHMTSGELEAAQAAWSRLDDAGAEHYLHKFKSGLLALARDDFATCIALLEEGMQANDVNAALTEDMRKIKEAAAMAMTSATPALHTAPMEPDTEINHFMLNRYQQNQEKK